MASRDINQGRHQELLDGLQKTGALSRTTVIHVSPTSITNEKVTHNYI